MIMQPTSARPDWQAPARLLCILKLQTLFEVLLIVFVKFV